MLAFTALITWMYMLVMRDCEALLLPLSSFSSTKLNNFDLACIVARNRAFSRLSASNEIANDKNEIEKSSSSLFTQSIADSDKADTIKNNSIVLNDDVQRYRNRATLLEHVLNSKLSELQMVQSKLIVLQNVIIQLKQKATAESDDWQKQLQQQRRQRAKLEESLNSLTIELNTTLSQLEEEQQNHINSMKQIKANNGLLLRTEKQSRDDIQYKAQQRITALQNEVLELSNSLQKVQQEASQIKSEYRMIQNEQKDSINQLGKEKLKVSHLHRLLSDMNLEKQSLLKKMEQIEETKAESLEIATASVSAAERREQSMRVELETVQQHLKSAREEAKNYSKKMKELLDSKEVQTDTTRLGQTANHLLQKEIDDLFEQIRSLKLTHSAQLVAERKRAEEELMDLEQEYEKKLHRMRIAMKKQQQQPQKFPSRVMTSAANSVQNFRQGMFRRLQQPFRQE